jgi:nucleotide-binding universal stress UspA family protein
LDNVLLAYDGSPRADEALFLATYLADRWGTTLTVVTVTEKGYVPADTTLRAQRYLESHGVRGTYLEQSGSVGEQILKAAEEQGSNLIIIGGYGHSPVVEVVLGSAVDQVLRESRQPTLICR